MYLHPLLPPPIRGFTTVESHRRVSHGAGAARFYVSAFPVLGSADWRGDYSCGEWGYPNITNPWTKKHAGGSRRSPRMQKGKNVLRHFPGMRTLAREGFCVEPGGRPDPPSSGWESKIPESAPQTSKKAPFPEKSDFAPQTGISTSRRAFVLRVKS